MSKKDFLNLIGNIQGAKALFQEIQEFTPQLKQLLFELFQTAQKDTKDTKGRNKEIYSAIRFAVDKMKQDPSIVLGCDPNDPPDLKRELYHLKARYFHDDGKAPDSTKFVKIKKAYDQIKDQ